MKQTANIREKVISAATAKLAKKKGYVLKIKKVQIDWKPSDWSWMVGTPIYKKVEVKPTQTLLQKWLRDIHGIHIEVFWDYSDIEWLYCISHIGNIEKENIESKKPYKSHEEALEDGLKIALQMIP